MNNQEYIQTGTGLNKFYAKIYGFLALGIQPLRLQDLLRMHY